MSYYTGEEDIGQGPHASRFPAEYAQEQMDRARARASAPGFSVGTSEPHPQMVYKGSHVAVSPPPVGYLVALWEHDRWTDTWDGNLWPTREQAEASAADAAETKWRVVVCAVMPIEAERP